MSVEPNVTARRMIQIFTQYESLDQWRNVVILCFVTQDSQITLFNVDVSRSQIIQNDSKQCRIAVNENGTAVVAQ